MKIFNRAFLSVFILAFAICPTFAQEGEPVVIDEVVAQVNEGVITLSRVKRQMKDAAEAITAQNGKAPDVARAEVEAKQGELIANMINEELLVQKGKELGMDDSVEASVNQRFREIMQEQKLKSLDELYKKMREAGFNPDEIRANLRRDFMREQVFGREVFYKTYYALSKKEIDDYFAQHPQKFLKPEMITISQIFLGFAGKIEDDVRAKAKDLVAQLRKGADFEKLAVENSDAPDVKTTKGKAGTFKSTELNEIFTKPLAGLKTGQIADPVESETGIVIVRVDERTDTGKTPVRNEDEIRRAISSERFDAERKKYMVELREQSYIKISENYRAMVSPVLFQEERSDAAPKTGKKN